MKSLSLSIGLLFIVTVTEFSVTDVAIASIFEHPTVTVTQADLDLIRSEIGGVPNAQHALDNLTAKVDQIMAERMDLPSPKDAGGGYTHEQHKRNYQAMYDAALVYQITADPRYLTFVRSLLLKYSQLYPTLGFHPKRKEQSPGKLFWQSLNEAVWLVYTIQAYDLVYSGLSLDDRTLIERDLLRPMAEFLSAGQPKTFNKIHNHGTWAAAAVGMTGYTLGDPTLVKQALYGLDMTGEAGFLKQIERLFSPDGYYAEGPYYQRYALMPFVLFAKAIDVNEPERKIFEYKDQALLKAIRTTVHLSYNGLFFGINDAIKDKGIDTTELVHGIAIAYEITQDASLLSVAKRQNHTLLTGYGFTVAKAIHQGLSQPFQFKSMQLRDGAKGDQGALAIFRNGFQAGHQALVMKNTSQGLGHGHFDKLHWLYFDNGQEIISDYGAARFLNIEAKYGGHYLPENTSWAKQTIAHNTVVVDETSHFDGDWRRGQKFAPEVLFFDVTANSSITSASLADAYQDVKLKRTMAMVKHRALDHPLIIDVFDVSSGSKHQYDLPLHYEGQLISHTLALGDRESSLTALGTRNGYQHLWGRAKGKFDSPLAQVTWLNHGRFYTYSTLGSDGDEVIFTQLGANDPNFNLLNKNALIHRVYDADQHTYVAVLETHGEYNGRLEYTTGAQSKVVDLGHTKKGNVTVIDVTFVDDGVLTLIITPNGDQGTEHSIKHKGQTVEWVGHYTVLRDE